MANTEPLQTEQKVGTPDISSAEIKAICCEVYRLNKDYSVIRIQQQRMCALRKSNTQ